MEVNGETKMVVLCVDTNIIALFGLKRKVKKIIPKARVFTCERSDDAIKIAREQGCDVLITEIDLGREKGEGIHLSEAVKELNSHVNIIFMTAGFVRDYAQHLVKVRYSGVLTKPFNIEELKDELDNLRYQQPLTGLEQSEA